MSGRKVRKAVIRDNQVRSPRVDYAALAAERRARAECERTAQMMRRFDRQQQEMQQDFRNGLDALASDLGTLERQQNERLDQVRREAAMDLASLDRDLNRRIEKQGERFHQAIRRHRAEVDGALARMNRRIARDRELQRRAAEAQIADIGKLLKLMRSQDAHARFAPGELDSLESSFQLCRSNLEGGNYQAALAGAQERYLDYQRLRLRIAEREAEWQAYLAEARRLAEEMTGAVAAAEKARFRLGEGEDAPRVEAQVDYWSDGALTELRGRVEAHLKRLRSPEELRSLSSDDLERMVRELGPMEAELEGIVERAKERMIHSQLRQNLAASILASFKGTAWALDDSTYERQDFRKGLHLKLKNPSEEEIVASVRPMENDGGGMGATVEINFFDRLNDESLRQARLRDMNKRMHAEGVQPGSFECIDDSEGRPGAARMRDFERLRQPAEGSAPSSS